MVTNYVKTVSYWNLAVVEKTVMITKFFICGILLYENAINTKEDSLLNRDTEKLERLAFFETIYQIEKWSEVEDTHAVNKADLLRNISAAYKLISKNRERLIYIYICIAYYEISIYLEK